jgi:hypothetical protein
MNGVANGLYGGDLPNQINTPWIDFSEQSTIVGWSAYTTKRIRYKVVGNIVYVNLTLQIAHLLLLHFHISLKLQVRELLHLPQTMEFQLLQEDFL